MVQSFISNVHLCGESLNESDKKPIASERVVGYGDCDRELESPFKQ
jgi:hypothetical protein